MGELTERIETILGIVVRKYIATAAPVGSKTIAEEHHLGISPATVRNEMAILEEQGYLTHPHTSAGRIPTQKGYRYFVEHLMGETELPLAERRMIRHQFHQAGMELEQWMKLAAAVLANTAHSAALVTAPKAMSCRFKHLKLISIHDLLALLILVLREGTIKQQMIPLAQPMAQSELNRIANKLNATLADSSHDEIAAGLPHLSPFEEKMVNYVIEMMGQVDGWSSSEIYRNGLAHILRQPEFAEVEKVWQFLQVLEQGSILESILAEVWDSNGVQVIIGGEGHWGEIDGCSAILSRYGVAGEAGGVLGVLGPMRMAYERAFSTVRYVAGLMNGLIRKLYGY